MAGGLNLYGFGGGDPVNYSDPYGLCPEKPLECPVIREAVAVTTQWGEEATEAWANQSVTGSSGVSRGAATLMGHFSALWTPDTYERTTNVLRTGWDMAMGASGPNQMNNDSNKPRTVDRADPAFPGSGDSQPHIHFHRMRQTLNRDGTWGHGADPENLPQLTKEERRWVESHGWKTEPE